MKLTSRYRSLPCFALAITLLSGCSLGIFGDAKDKDTETLRSYRKVNDQCGGVELGQSELTLTQLRGWVSCLNANGGIPEIAAFVQKGADGDLEPLVAMLNRAVLQDPKFLYGLERTVKDLDQSGELDSLLKNVAAVGRHANWIEAAAGLFRESSGLLGGAFGKPDSFGDPDFFKALKVVGDHLAKDEVNPAASGLAGRGLEDAELMLTARAFSELRSQLLADSSTGGLTLTEASQHLASFFQQSTQDGKFLEDALQAAVNGELSGMLESVIGKDETELRAKARKFSVLFNTLFADQASLARDFAKVAQFLADPIACFNDGVAVKRPLLVNLHELADLKAPNDAVLADKAADRLGRLISLRLMGLSPMCTLPTDLASHLNPFKAKLVQSAALVPLVEGLRGIFAVKRKDAAGNMNEPLAELMLDLVESPAFEELLPIFGELDARKAWDDLVLVANRPMDAPAQPAQPVGNGSSFLTEAQPELLGRTVGQVVVNAVAKSGASSLLDALRAGREMLEASEGELLPLLKSLKRLSRLNDAKPGLRLAARVLQAAPEQEAFFRASLRLVTTPEFKRVLESLPRQAESGNLRDVLRAAVSLFSRYAAGASYPIHAPAAPAPMRIARHDLIGSELTPYQAPAVAHPIPTSCSSMDFGVSLAEPTGAKFKTQMSLFLQCLDANGEQTLTVDALNYLLNETTSSGESFYAYQIELIRSQALSKDAYAFLREKFLALYDSGAIGRFLRGIPYFTTAQYQGGEALRALVRLFKPLSSKAALAVSDLQVWLGKALVLTDATDSLRYLDRVGHFSENLPSALNAASHANAPPNLNSEKARLEKWIKAKECDQMTMDAVSVEKRAQEILSDYTDAVTSWELRSDWTTRKSWPIGEFRPPVEEALDKLAQPAVVPNDDLPASGTKQVVHSLVRTLRYFSLAPGQAPTRQAHYTPETLQKWLHDRANDYRPITYFYPNDPEVRVRYVSTLDMLELVVINADYIPPWPFDKNYSLLFLTMLGEAWGDEPRAIWPAEIEAKYQQTGDWPLTLKQAVAAIWDQQESFESLVGFPKILQCTQATGDPQEVAVPNSGLIPGGFPVPFVDIAYMKGTLYNLRQVLQSIDENLPNSGAPNAGGLKVLRDLFFQLTYSTPEADRNPKAGWKNHLALVARLARMGMMRNLSRALREFPKGDPELTHFFAGFMEAVLSPKLDQVLQPLIVKDLDHRVIWSVLTEAFKVLDLPAATDGRANLRGSAFQSVAAFAGLNAFGSVFEVLGPTLAKHRDFIALKAPNFTEAMTEGKLERFLRALAQDQDSLSVKFTKLPGWINQTLAIDTNVGVNGVQALQAVIDSPEWKAFGDRRDLIAADPGFKALQWSALATDLKNFVLEESSDPMAIATAHEMRFALAKLLRDRRLDPMLETAGKNPDEFYRLFTALGTTVEKGDLEDLLAFFRRGLAN